MSVLQLPVPRSPCTARSAIFEKAVKELLCARGVMPVLDYQRNFGPTDNDRPRAGGRSAAHWNSWGTPGITSLPLPARLRASLSFCITETSLVWESQVANAVPLRGRACFLFTMIRTGQTKHPDLLRWRDFSERNGKRVGVVAYANYHSFILGDKLLIMVCLVWINLGRHRMTVHSLTLT